MITHFLSEEQVEAYCKDFAHRIIDLGTSTPKVWCPIGLSGIELFKKIAKFLPKEIDRKTIYQPITYTKPSAGRNGAISVALNENSLDTEEIVISQLKEMLKNESTVIVIDSSVHSGSSMLGALKFLESLGANEVLAYSLVIKQNTCFVPHYFGLIVGDHDRALFLLDSIPNNRLSKPKTTFKGVLRKLAEQDALGLDKLDTGVDSISKVGWGDLWYEVRANDFQVYVVETAGKLAGYVKYKIAPSGTLHLDTIAVDKARQGEGVGGALFRWTETTARSYSCHSMELWGIEAEVENYKKAGYVSQGQWLNVGESERYLRMSKPLLYHFDLKKWRES